jgi:hypothetical protein
MNHTVLWHDRAAGCHRRRVPAVAQHLSTRVLVTVAVLLALTPVIAIATVSTSVSRSETCVLTICSLRGGRFA